MWAMRLVPISPYPSVPWNASNATRVLSIVPAASTTTPRSGTGIGPGLAGGLHQQWHAAELVEREKPRAWPAALDGQWSLQLELLAGGRSDAGRGGEDVRQFVERHSVGDRAGPQSVEDLPAQGPVHRAEDEVV